MKPRRNYFKITRARTAKFVFFDDDWSPDSTRSAYHQAKELQKTMPDSRLSLFRPSLFDGQWNDKCIT